jgi:branched-chain amino acid transport system permease protein
MRIAGRSLLPVAGFAAGIPALHLTLRALGAEYCLTQLTMAVYYAIVVVGLGLLMGYAGQVSLGHGAFFALGGRSTYWWLNRTSTATHC